MAMISVGVDHTRVPLEVLEAVTVPDSEQDKVLAALAALDDLAEVVLVSTCLRTEVYASVERFHGAVDGITSVLAERAGLDAPGLAPLVTVHFDRGVPAHLFAVAAGLRSAVPGETEVLGQLRRSLERATEQDVAGGELSELFRRALSAGRRARSETAIARGTTSFAHATVAMAADRLGALDGRRVVVLGAGQLATGITEGLAEGRRGTPSSIVVVNRTVASADSLVSRWPRLAEARSLDALADAMRGADLIVSAVESDAPLVSAEMLEGVGGSVLVVDLGMPRTVAHDRDVDGVTLLDLGHLRGVVDAALADRREELAHAEALVAQEVGHFLEDRRARGAAPLVTALRARFEAVRDDVVTDAAGDLSTLSAEQRARVEQLTRALVNKLAHDPTVALRESAGTDRGQRLSEAVRALFDL